MAMTNAPAVAGLHSAAGTPSVPILGHVALKSGTETGGDDAVGTLHGVRRIPGGTVIYYSLGYPASTKGHAFILGLEERSRGFTRYGGPFGALTRNMLVDTPNKKVYGGLVRANVDTSVQGGRGESDCICNTYGGVDLFGDRHYKKGQAIVLYQVVAALPASVAFVDVYISGQVIGHVKVEDGVMTPEVDHEKPVLVGMGWPKVDPGWVASSVEPAKSVIDLITTATDLEGTVTTRATPKQVSVALASDVLFATDQATLSGKAQSVLRQAAADVKSANGAGTLQVVGYTDNTGSPKHNVDLSRRRATAVAAALRPLLGSGVQLPTSGKGEADPVAPNTTSAGRASNRRVSVVFAPAGGAK